MKLTRMNHSTSYYILYYLLIAVILQYSTCLQRNHTNYVYKNPFLFINPIIQQSESLGARTPSYKTDVPVQKNGVLLVDATGLAYRCYYGMPELTTHMGYEIGCLYGFLNSLSYIFRTFEPEYVGLAFDAPDASTVKRKIWPKYKIHRKITPPSLIDQIGYIKDYCEISGLPILYYPETEADDLIATGISQIKTDKHINIITSDKDLFQLLSRDSITIIQPQKSYRLVDSNVVFKDYGITPNRFAEYLAIVGDASDGIPGILGIGPQTAPKLIAEYSTFEEILGCKTVEKIREKGGKYAESVDMAWNFYNLTKLNSKIPMQADLESLVMTDPLEKQLEEFYKKYSLRKHASKWSVLQK